MLTGCNLYAANCSRTRKEGESSLYTYSMYRRVRTLSSLTTILESPKRLLDLPKPLEYGEAGAIVRFQPLCCFLVLVHKVLYFALYSPPAKMAQICSNLRILCTPRPAVLCKVLSLACLFRPRRAGRYLFHGWFGCTMQGVMRFSLSWNNHDWSNHGRV